MEFKIKILTLRGGRLGGGHKVMDSVLLCNSGKIVLAKTLDKRIYKERRKRPKKGEFILNEYDKKGIVKLYLFIENIELS